MHKNIFIKIFIRVIILSLVFILPFFVHAQSTQPIPPPLPSVTPPSNGETSSYLRWGPNGLNRGIPYGSVAGSPFWNDDWRFAMLYGKTINEKWLCKTKLNLATGEVYFLDNKDEEKVFDNDIIKRIIFYNTDDTATRTAVFISWDHDFMLNEQKVKPYLQVLNDGKYELMKLTTRIVSSGDSMLGTLRRYYFSTQTKYFVSGNLKTEPVKKLKKENILIYLPNSSKCEDWLNQKKIDFRKEEDMIAFFNYYNSQNLTVE